MDREEKIKLLLKWCYLYTSYNDLTEFNSEFKMYIYEYTDILFDYCVYLHDLDETPKMLLDLSHDGLLIKRLYDFQILRDAMYKGKFNEAIDSFILDVNNVKTLVHHI